MIIWWKVKIKNKMALFYIHLMSLDKEIVSLTNKTHNNWMKAKDDYEHSDSIIQRDNIAVRIPEYLDEEDKK